VGKQFDFNVCYSFSVLVQFQSRLPQLNLKSAQSGEKKEGERKTLRVGHHVLGGLEPTSLPTNY
jgi:hypothetical protein